MNPTPALKSYLALENLMLDARASDNKATEEMTLGKMDDLWKLLSPVEIEYLNSRTETMTLKAALEHALICPLAQDAFRTMRDEPEKLTACERCRSMLLVWRDGESK